ncbi:peptide MFS transporter [Sporolactobacillus kofuensis]|uniref:Peptide MFS transporter n=1 Tax=Sporolactobacillus kofuensis TaxID=269672 RepID=A0ABW1WFA5_9BACL|nr:peptide MFS transporter [Sporolactobacillus kofuensis]MCO7174902.1 peptide MFS transporter [Sporolactobacillus kofuensis]
MSTNSGFAKVSKRSSQGTFLGHPKGLFTLFFTELWERFSYYGMRAILLYYMYDQIRNGGLGLSMGVAASLMSIYGALVFMSGIAGGWMADRIFGLRRTILFGGVLIMLGHIVLSIPAGVPALFVSMALIIIGTGLLKPTIATTVGTLYAPGDLRRDSGFSIYYTGINLGAFLAPYVVGTLGQNYNYHLGFSCAAIGMAIGLLIFVINSRKNERLTGGGPVNPLNDLEKKRMGIWLIVFVLAILTLVILSIAHWLTVPRFVSGITLLGIILPICYFTMMIRSAKTKPEERLRVYAYIPLFIASIFFWMIQEQGAVILATFADTRTDLSLGHFTIPSSWIQSLNPVFIILFAPIFSYLWMKLGKKQPSTSKKFAMGLFFAAVSFLIMALPGFLFGTSVKVSVLWLVVSFLLVVFGELCLSPIGLSVTTKLAPKAFAAQTMSLWLLSDATAQAINAKVVPLYNSHTEVTYFTVMGSTVLVISMVLFLTAPIFQQMMKDVE